MAKAEKAKKNGKITVVTGAGTAPIDVATNEPLAMREVLERADVVLEQGETPVVGEAMIENLDAMVSPGQMVVIDSMPSNG